jgi:hypothetical protein
MGYEKEKNNKPINKLGRGIIKALTKKTPVVREIYDFVENVKESDQDSKTGKVNWYVTIPSILLSGGVLFIFAKGLLSFEQTREFIDIILSYC